MRPLRSAATLIAGSLEIEQSHASGPRIGACGTPGIEHVVLRDGVREISVEALVPVICHH
jgi:hypothetical protein